MLLKGERLSLINLVLNGLLLYFFSLLKTFVGGINSMEKLIRDFFWNGG